MKLEAGMFVRTKDGEIGKITHIETETFSEPAYTLDIFSQGIYKGCKWFDGKASYNIIDLIEVGDYVNGSEVLDFENKYIKESDEFVPIGVITEHCYLENTDSWIIEKDIKSIVTKECFESMSYKVGE